MFGRITPYTLHAPSWPNFAFAPLQPACDLRAMAVAANTEEQAAQVQAAQAAGFGPHMPLQITGVKQTPELNGLLCQMEDLRNHPVFPVTLSSAPAPCLLRACWPAIPACYPTCQKHKAKPDRVLVRITESAAATAAGNRGGTLLDLQP